MCFWVLLAVPLAGSALAEAERFAELRFDHKPPIKLDVGKLEVVRAFEPRRAPPDVAYLFPIPPDLAVERWAFDRIKPVGGGNLARVVINQAAVVEVPLETTGGLVGWFKTEQSERYDATLEVLVEIRTDFGRQAYAGATVKRSQTVAEDISPEDRRRVWHQMTEKMLQDMDRQLEDGIAKYLVKYRR
jgi:hypothetical protein